MAFFLVLVVRKLCKHGHLGFMQAALALISIDPADDRG